MSVRIWQRLDLKLHSGRWATIIVLDGGAQRTPINEGERQSVPVRMVLPVIVWFVSISQCGRLSSLTVYVSSNAP